MRVVLEAELQSGVNGGVETVVIGLAAGLSTLTDSDDEYVFLTGAGDDDWLRPHVSGPCRIETVPVPAPAAPAGMPPVGHAAPGASVPREASLARRVARGIPGMRAAYRGLQPAYRRLQPVYPRIRAAYRDRRSARKAPSTDVPPPSNGIAERLRADVVHFPYQGGFLTDIPSIYHPHDLQHLHLPEFFSPETIRHRETYWRLMCRQARLVAVETQWVREDVIRQYRLSPEKVVVVPFAPILGAYPNPGDAETESVRRLLGLPDAFVLYPAQTWRHKNHLALFRALADLRRRGTIVPLVCSGRTTDFQPVLAEAAELLGIADQVQWVGFVSELELRSLYALARAVIVPTLFEAASMLLWEAFEAGVPVACSNVTSLPEQAGDAAIVFDPRNDAAIADAVLRLWTDADLRRTLIDRGRTRIAGLSWARTAAAFREHYRSLAAGPHRR